MKKVIAICLSVIMILCNCVVVFAEPIELDDLPDEVDTNVKVTYNKEDNATVYSVNISWGALLFKYTTTGGWDATNHIYTNGSWSPEGNVAASQITVVNHSNAAVLTKINISDDGLNIPSGSSLNLYNADDRELPMAIATGDTVNGSDSGKVINSADGVGTDETSVKENLTRVAYVEMKNSPNKVFSNGTVAKITVTISPLPLPPTPPLPR